MLSEKTSPRGETTTAYSYSPQSNNSPRPSMPPDFSDVFGVSAKQVGSYVEREDVDRAFKEALKMGDQIVVYGASKQGKTSLVRRHLKPDSYITVNITPKTELIDIYRSILRQHGVVVETVRTDSTERSPKFTSRAKLAIKVPF